ncbi:MAG: dockerin type I domain-containing protein [Candidatus Woykebacteria bacterium]
MAADKKLSPKNKYFIIPFFLILLLLPLTVYSTLSARPSAPEAASCYDLNGDGVVDEDDLALVQKDFGKPSQYDQNGDGVITSADIAIISAHKGDTCPPTADFRASRTRINKGESSTLRWSTTRTGSVSISSLGTVAKSGSKVVRPGATTTYLLTARGPGGVITKSVKITVAMPSSTVPGSSQTAPPPVDSTSITFLTFTFEPLPELSGNLTTSILIEKTKFKQNVILTSKTEKLSFKVKAKTLVKNKIYTIVLAGEKILTKKVRFKSASYKPIIKMGKIYLGDISLNNIIDETDLEKLSSNFAQGSSDVNLDGVINSLDYSIIITNLGRKGN